MCTVSYRPCYCQIIEQRRRRSLPASGNATGYGLKILCTTRMNQCHKATSDASCYQVLRVLGTWGLLFGEVLNSPPSSRCIQSMINFTLYIYIHAKLKSLTLSFFCFLPPGRSGSVRPGIICRNLSARLDNVITRMTDWPIVPDNRQ